MKRFLAWLLPAAALLLNSCGSGGSLPEAPAPDASHSIPAAGLPDPATLAAEAGRQLSIAGPGWYSVDLHYRNLTGMESGVSDGADAITITGAGQAAFAVWGVQGFKADAYPTSLHAEVANVSGSFYLAYTDYVDGRWRFGGPFTDSSTFEYPNVDAFADPTNNTSSRDNHFVAIIVPDGDSLDLADLAVGVHGGDLGPDPLYQIGENSNASQVVIRWIPSTSNGDPDFAGYSVDRAIFPGGDYTRLTQENIFEDFFVDSTAEAGKLYSYIITVWDSAGNSAPSWGVPAALHPGGTSSPLCKVDMPKGPLQAPVKVRFDLSESFDPDGDAITEYTFEFGSGISKVIQPDPVLEITLQPGCYNMRFMVKADGNTGTAYRYLKVYPQWQPDSHAVTAGPAYAPRVFAPRSFFDAESGQVVFLYSDATIPALVAEMIDSSGNITRSYAGHLRPDGTILCSEPQFIGGAWMFLACYQYDVVNYAANLFKWEDGKLEIVPGGSFDPLNTVFTDIVADGNDNFWVLTMKQSVNYDLHVENLALSQDIPVISGLLDDKAFDAEWNPDAEAIDIVYSGNGSTEWLRWSPVIGPIDSKVIHASDSQFMDLAVDPDTGRPAVLFQDNDFIRFSELNDDNATWTAAEKVDTIDPDRIMTKLMYRDGTAWCYVADNPDGAALYRYDGAGLWSNVNEAPHQFGGLYLSCEYNPAVPGFYVMDQASNFPCYTLLMQEDGTEEVLDTLEGWKRSGLELSAASSFTDIHLIHNPIGNYSHFKSADGVNWTETTDAGMGTGGALAADQNGKVYATLVNGGNVYLREWNDPAWVDQESQVTTPESRPQIFGQGGDLYFGAFNGLAVPAEYYLKKNLDPVQVILPDSSIVWDGAIACIPSASPRILLRYGGMDYEDGVVGVMDTFIGTFTTIFEPGLSFHQDPYTQGRHYEGAYLQNNYQVKRLVFYAAYGPGSGPCRMVQSLLNTDNWDLTSFPAGGLEGDINLFRRSVSAAEAWGNTSVGLCSTLLGEPLFFEWDNFGNFEDLPWPAGIENSAFHELVVGPDGRWHMLYRDNLTDELRVISTVS